MSSDARTDQMKTLSPKRNTSGATTAAELTAEQLKHFHIEPDTEYGQTLSRVVERMYESQGDISHLWQLTLESMNSLDQNDRIQRFNAKKFPFIPTCKNPRYAPAPVSQELSIPRLQIGNHGSERAVPGFRQCHRALFRHPRHHSHGNLHLRVCRVD